MRAKSNALTLFAISLLTTDARAQATISDTGFTAPTPAPFDISQFSVTGGQNRPEGLDSRANPNYYPGQSFTTDSLPDGYLLDSVSIKTFGSGRDRDGSETARSFTLNLYSLSGNGLTNATLIQSYTASGTIRRGGWIRWSNLLPPLRLAPDTVYACAFGPASGGGGGDSLSVAGHDPYEGGQIGLFPADGGAVIYGAGGGYDATFNIGLLSGATRPSGGWPVAGAPVTYGAVKSAQWPPPEPPGFANGTLVFDGQNYFFELLPPAAGKGKSTDDLPSVLFHDIIPWPPEVNYAFFGGARVRPNPGMNPVPESATGLKVFTVGIAVLGLWMCRRRKQTQ